MKSIVKLAQYDYFFTIKLQVFDLLKKMNSLVKNDHTYHYAQ